MSSYSCPRCRITFAVREPDSAEYTRCAEPGCGLPFWHGIKDRGVVQVGIYPDSRPCVTARVIAQAHQGKPETRVLAGQFRQAVRDAVQKSSVVHAHEGECEYLASPL